MINLKPVGELDFGFMKNDANNYKGRSLKELFNRIFIKSSDLDKLLDNQLYFLIGEKGTGKTAFALYLTNNFYKNTRGFTVNVEAADYDKFIDLKKNKNIPFADYTSIWKVIIHMLISKQIYEDYKEEKSIFDVFPKFTGLQKAIDEYYFHAFSPEITKTFPFIEQSNESAEIISKHLKNNSISEGNLSFSADKFSLNIMYIQKKFEDAIESLNLKKDYILFIDGIDIRPSNVSYADYIECVKGLGAAVWQLNNSFFGERKQSKGKIKIVLLLRPDIFMSIDFQNLNSKLRDNSLLLNWHTDYKDYATSEIYKMADRLFSAQQNKENLPLGVCWNHYFPFQTSNGDNSFILLLRNSLLRPRDIVTMMQILQNIYNKKSRLKSDVFTQEYFKDEKNFALENSMYLFREIKDQISFYYSQRDYEIFTEFFQYMHFLQYSSLRFSYKDYTMAYNAFLKHAEQKKYSLPLFFENAESLLQFLYDLNIIGYTEQLKNGKLLVRWCYRERTTANIAPLVKINALEYNIHVGFMRALERIIQKK